MDEQQRAVKKKYAGEKQPSMKRRDDNHDYTERRMYMITMEVEDRRPLFGVVTGDPHAPQGSSDSPHIVLSPIGQAVQDEWLGIPRYYPQIEVVAVQMMPDHMHGILFVKERIPVHLSQIIKGFKTGCNRLLKAARNTQPADKQQASPQAAPSSRLSPSQQSLSELHLFAPGYNDLILRSFDELPVWKNYLHDNPRRLLMKREHPEFLRPFFQLRLGSHTYNGIGNRALLSAPLSHERPYLTPFDSRAVRSRNRPLSLGSTGWHRAHLASHITRRETCHACRLRRRPSYCGHHGKRLYAPFKAPWGAV